RLTSRACLGSLLLRRRLFPCAFGGLAGLLLDVALTLDGAAGIRLLRCGLLALRRACRRLLRCLLRCHRTLHHRTWPWTLAPPAFPRRHRRVQAASRRGGARTAHASSSLARGRLRRLAWRSALCGLLLRGFLRGLFRGFCSRLLRALGGLLGRRPPLAADALLQQRHEVDHVGGRILRDIALFVIGPGDHALRLHAVADHLLQALAELVLVA